MKIKVCGITSVDQLNQLAQMKIDFAGLIFVTSSPRFAPAQLSAETKAVRECSIQKVGVFVNEEMAIVRGRIKEFGLNAVQLHGDEDPGYARELNTEIPVIKAFRISGNEDITVITKPFVESANYFLFDTFSQEGYGGTGQTFNWDNLDNAAIEKPFFLSGGISPGHAKEVISFRNPKLYSVDINSRFETSPGVKDLALVKEFKIQLEQTRNLHHEQ